ncbi:hypothetical protein ASPWEDRAFT_46487 [Aspergillus wentii DTO 134E9]|uniref:Single-strand DNA deaminase toxin A-like C-terminal domain-containing protein n=1 Tax=Aspergillus wentii DTO 134E9 TaxID=1073089 RepID=A0A1L9R493_ASPWE|nr:uncharacterized protein ASPWEDRAFT_46487 [Aspergillus wentii DTO 134E9]OJJ29745.1 hypothetical protein ASPWEDRAFT_46487 [Aspergillus wentii DTO 134E9]
MSGINIPSANVIWWDNSNVYILCPYCEETHRHGFNPSDYQDGLRVPHCNSGNSYRLEFPIDRKSGTVAYEIDKPNARFINIGMAQYLEEESEDTLSKTFSSKATISESPPKASEIEISFDVSKEKVVYDLGHGKSFTKKRITEAISDCVTGEIYKVKSYLDESTDASTFLHGRDSNGDTCLIMASMERSPLMVSLLLCRGSDVNAINKNGRTALMEAALWGRLDNVELLLPRGADQSLRDNENRDASDLAQPTRRNAKERYRRAGGIIGDTHSELAYKEDTFKRDHDRRNILRILGDKSRTTASHQSASKAPNPSGYSFTRASQAMTLHAPMAEYPISRESKTLAVLVRGSRFPNIAAMSGWAHQESSILLSGKDWTDKVMQLANIVGHQLAPDAGRDKTLPGQYQASHAEKQLIAYFVDRHVFLRQYRDLVRCLERQSMDLEDRMLSLYFSPPVRRLFDLQRKKENLNYELLDKDDHIPGKEYDKTAVNKLKEAIRSVDQQLIDLEAHPEVKRFGKLGHRMQALERKKDLFQRLNAISASNVMPPATLKDPAILIGSSTFEICDDCNLFKEKVNSFLGLSIEWRECTERNLRTIY